MNTLEFVKKLWIMNTLEIIQKLKKCAEDFHKLGKPEKPGTYNVYYACEEMSEFGDLCENAADLITSLLAVLYEKNKNK